MSSSQPEFPAVAPASLSRVQLKTSVDLDRHAKFLRMSFLQNLKRASTEDMADPKFFDRLVELTFTQLKERITHVGMNDMAEASGLANDNAWMERAETLVVFVQLKLQFDVFKALCAQAFEEYQWDTDLSR